MTPDFLPLLMRWMHILAAIIAVGGSFFMRLVLMPSVKAALSDETHQQLRDALIPRWRRVVHTCIALFLISGFYNYLVVTRPLHADQPIYHALFGIKFLLALAVFALAIVLTSSGGWAAPFKAKAPAWLGLLVALALAVVLISGFLRMMPTV